MATRKSARSVEPAEVEPAEVELEEIEENEESELTLEDCQQLRDMLLTKRDEVVAALQKHMAEAMDDNENLPDEMDLAERQSRQAYLFRLADKDQKLLREIDHALTKFSRGTYGICEGTGDPIGLKRLRLRPWTRYSIEYKEMLERERNGRR